LTTSDLTIQTADVFRRERRPRFGALDPQHVELADQVGEDDRAVAEAWKKCHVKRPPEYSSGLA